MYESICNFPRSIDHAHYSIAIRATSIEKFFVFLIHSAKFLLKKKEESYNKRL